MSTAGSIVHNKQGVDSRGRDSPRELGIMGLDREDPNSVLVSLASSLFCQMQVSVGEFLGDAVRQWKEKLDSEKPPNALPQNSTTSFLPQHFVNHLFSYRKSNTYLTNLRLISETASQYDTLALFYLYIMEWLPSPLVIPQEMKLKLKDVLLFESFAAQPSRKAADASHTKHTSFIKPTDFSFDAWLSTTDMKLLLRSGDQCLAKLLPVPTPSKKKGSKKAQQAPHQTHSMMQLLQMIVLTTCADITSVILRSFEVENAQMPAETTVENDLDSEHSGALEAERHMDGIRVEVPSTDDTWQPDSPLPLPGVVSSPQIQLLLTSIMKTCIHILHFIKEQEISSSSFLWNTYASTPLYQWFYCVRRISIFDFPLSLSILCQHLKYLLHQDPEPSSSKKSALVTSDSFTIPQQVLLNFQVLRYIDVRVDSIQSNDALQDYLDFLLENLNRFALAPITGKKKKRKKLGGMPFSSVAIAILHAFSAVYSQLDFEKQHISHLQVKTNNIFQRVSLLTKDGHHQKTRCAAYQLASTIIAHSRFEWYNDAAEKFAHELVGAWSSFDGEDWILYDCLTRLLEDKDCINPNLHFVDLFPIDDAAIERNADFTTLVYGESNKQQPTNHHDASHISERGETMDDAQVDTSSQAHQQSKNMYQAVRMRLFKQLLESIFRSTNSSLLTEGISLDNRFEAEIFYLSWMILRMSQASLEQVTQSLLPDLLSIDVTGSKPELLMLGLRVLRMFVCVSEKAKVDDTATFTPHMLRDLRQIHQLPHYELFAEEVVRKNFMHVQKVIEYCDAELGVNPSKQLTDPIPASSYLQPKTRFEDLHVPHVLSSVDAVGSQVLDTNNANDWRQDSPHHSMYNSLSGYSFFSVAQTVLSQVREQNDRHKDESSSLTAAIDFVEPNALSPISPSAMLHHATPPSPPMSPTASKKPRLKLLIERNAHLLKVADQPPTPSSTKSSGKKKSQKKKNFKTEADLAARRTLFFKVYLEVLRCIPFIVPEQLVKTVDPSHFIGSRLVYNNSLIAVACSQALQRMFCERRDLRPYIIEGCVMLLQSEKFDSNEASLITILDNITLMVHFWRDINKNEISQMLCDVEQTNEQIIGQLKASRWDENKAWINKVETVAVSCLCSPNFQLRRSAVSALESLSELIDSEKVDSLVSIEKHWTRRRTFFDILQTHQSDIIQSAIYTLSMEDNFYSDDISSESLKWRDELSTLTIMSISQRDDCHLLWNLILVEVVRKCQALQYTKILVPMLELLHKRANRLLASSTTGASQTPPLTTDNVEQSERHKALYWTNLMSLFFAGAGSTSSTDLQTIHSEVVSVLDGSGSERRSIWECLSSSIHEWISTAVVKSVSKVHPDSSHLVIESLNSWLTSTQESSQEGQQNKKKKSKRSTAPPRRDPSVFHMTDFACRLCYNLSTHLKRLSEEKRDSYQLLLDILHRVRLTFESNGYELFRAPNQLVKYLESLLYFCNALLYLGRIFSPQLHKLQPLTPPYVENSSVEWKNDELTQNIIFLQHASGFTEKRSMNALSTFMTNLLGPGGTKTGKRNRKNQPPPLTAAQRGRYTERFNVLVQKIEQSSQSAISQLVKLNPLSLFEKSTASQDIPPTSHLIWFQHAEKRGYRVLCPLLSLHFEELIDSYLERIYSARDSSVAALYMRAVRDTLFPVTSQYEDFLPVNNTVDHAVQFIKRQHDIVEHDDSTVASEPDNTHDSVIVFQKQVQKYKVQFLHLIAWCCFHEHDEIHDHAYQMACDFVHYFNPQAWHSESTVGLTIREQLEQFSSSFKTRSTVSLSRSAHSISEILCSVFASSTIEFFEETFFRFSTIPQDISPGQSWSLKILVPWCKTLIVRSQHVVDSVIVPLFEKITLSLVKRYGFSRDMRDLWVNLSCAYDSEEELESPSRVPINLPQLVQFLKLKARSSDMDRLNICREITVCIFNTFPEITLSLLLKDLKQLRQVLQQGVNAFASSDVAPGADVDETHSVTSHISHLSSKRGVRHTEKSIQGAAIVESYEDESSSRKELLRSCKAVVRLITDIVCEAKHVEHVFQNLPIIFNFALCYFDDAELKDYDFQKLLLNFLLRIGPTSNIQEWNMLCRLLSENENIQLNWNHKRYMFHESVTNALKQTEYESSCRNLLPILEREIYAVDLVKIFVEIVSRQLSSALVDQIGVFALDDALCTSLNEPELLYRHLVIYSAASVQIAGQRHGLQNIVYCLVKACEMAEMRLNQTDDYQLAGKCIQLCLQILSDFTHHYKEMGELHEQALLFWTAAFMLRYPFNDIYHKALDILAAFSDDISEYSFFEINAKPKDFQHSFAGLPALLINGFNRIKMEEATLKLLVKIVEVTAVNSAHSKEPNGLNEQCMENLLTVMLLLLVWIERDSVARPAYGDASSPERICQALSLASRNILHAEELAQAFDPVVLKRSKENFLSNIAAHASSLFFPMHSKQAMEILLCMLVSGQKKNQVSVIQITRHLMRFAPVETVECFSPLLSSCISLMQLSQENSNGLETHHDRLKQSIIDLLSVVSQKGASFKSFPNTNGNLSSPINHQFSLPSAKLNGLSMSVQRLIQVYAPQEVGARKPSVRGGQVGKDSVLPDVDAVLNGTGNRSAESSLLLNESDLDVPLDDDSRQDSQEEEYIREPIQQKPKLQFTNLVHAAMALNQVRRNAPDLNTPSRPSPLPTVIDFKENLLRNMRKKKSDEQAAPMRHDPPKQDESIATDTETDLDISIHDEGDPGSHPPLSPIYQAPSLLKSFSSLEDFSMSMSPSRRAPEPPKAPLRPAPKPFRKPRRVEEILNDPIAFSYFKSFCLRSKFHPALIGFYEEVRAFMRESNLTNASIMAQSIVARYLSNNSNLYLHELEARTIKNIVQAYHKNPQTPSKMLFSSAIEWIVSILDSYYDMFLESKEYVALRE